MSDKPGPQNPQQPTKANALAIYAKVDNPIAFANEMARTFAAMTGVPLEQGGAVALTCLCEGLTPVDYRRRYHTIDGKPSMRADAMLAEFRMNHGGKYKIVERSPERAAIVFIDRDGNEWPTEFTWQQAQESRWPWKDWKDHSKGFKDNWGTPTDRKALLWARCVSDGLRVMCPELVAGVYTPEEMQDVIDAESNGHVVIPAKSRVTATEILSQQAAATVATTNDNEVIGEVVLVEAEPAVSTAEVDGSNAQPHGTAVADPEDPTPGTISPSQLKTLKALVDDLGMTHDQLAAALDRRGVNSARSLSKEQAKEMIDKLRNNLKQREAANSPN